MLAEFHASCLWDSPEKFQLKMVAGADGIERLTFVVTEWASRETSSETAEETQSASAPAPTFEPAVPLPVLPQSDAEKDAIAGMCLDARFSARAISARVVAIEREARELRGSERSEGVGKMKVELSTN